MKHRCWACFALCFGLLVTVLGCGESGPKLIRATGTATYNGQPLVGAVVTFVFENGDVATGNTDASGKFALDAPAGEAKVAISKVITSGSESLDVKNMTPSDAMAKKYASKGKEQMEAKPKSEVPERYGKPDSSGLVASVKVGGTNDYSFALVD